MSAGPPKALKAYGVLPDADRVIQLGDLGPWRPKLVATDLDGTLLNSAGEVTPELSRVKASIASWLPAIAETSWTICSSGGWSEAIPRVIW